MTQKEVSQMYTLLGLFLYGYSEITQEEKEATKALRQLIEKRIYEN